MLVVSLRRKSSAVSVSNFSEPAGWDSAPTSPSGSPLAKKKGSAHAGVASHTPAVTVAATNRYFIHFSFRFFGSDQFDQAGSIDGLLRLRSGLLLRAVRGSRRHPDRGERSLPGTWFTSAAS